MSDTPKFIYPVCVVQQVTDGDTFRANVGMEYTFDQVIQIRKQKVRIKGIDAPELSGFTAAAGLAAKTFLQQILINHPVVTVKAYSQDDRHRWISDVFLDDGRDLARVILDAGHAVPWPTTKPPEPKGE